MPANSYILCTTPRSGSTLLCDLLTDTGLAGQPNSLFRRESFAEWAEHFEVDTSAWAENHLFDQRYLAASRNYGTNGTGVFGLRLMWESLQGLSHRLGTLYCDPQTDSERFAAAFDNPLYIHLYRTDKIAQAISHLRAEQSGLWHAHPDRTERERLSEPVPLRYDYEAISRLVNLHETHDQQWTKWFKRQEIIPLTATYESLSRNPGAAVQKILKYFDHTKEFLTRPKPRTSKLADTISQQWYDRFLADQRRIRDTRDSGTLLDGTEV